MDLGPLQRKAAESFVGAARRAPEGWRAAAMQSPAKGLIAGQILEGMAREFDGARGADLDAVVRWEVGPEGAEPEVWHLLIGDGRCRAARECEQPATTTIGLDHQTLLELAVGIANAPQAYITGRLRMKGDVTLAQRMTSLFRVPGATSPGS